ncbi:hypothetical protein HY416_03670 [Candidatus Kaiserbacteria bacterium]|nr:hypothetical protein [Candidatus Kaiserbacteria bacterium]
MDEVLLTNLFFVITGSAVLVITVFVCVVCWHVVRLVRHAHRILDHLEDGAESFMEDVRALRDRIGDYFDKGNIFGKIVSVIAGAVAGARRQHPTGGSRRAKKEIT